VKKTRADIRLVELGLVDSRTKAQARILAGQVFLDDRRIEKAGDQVPEEALLRVTELERYCSRGGKKLNQVQLSHLKSVLNALLELALHERTDPGS